MPDDPKTTRPVPNTWTVLLAILLPLLVLGLLFVTPCVIRQPPAQSTGTPVPESGLRGELDAAAWPKALNWVNAGKALSLSDLRGKVVLLSFWDCCCEACAKAIPDLAALEREYCDEMVIVGVNSVRSADAAAFEDLRKALDRRGIRFPVAHDPGQEFSRRYNIHSWPTHVLIDPAGKVVLERPGDNPSPALEPIIARLVRTFDAEGKIDRRPLPFGPDCE